MTIIEKECLNRLNAYNQQKASEIFKEGDVPLWEADTGKIRRDDGFLADKIKAIRRVYHKLPYLILKVCEDEVGAYYIFCSASFDPDDWQNERGENHVFDQSCQFIGPTYFPKLKRFSENELMGGTILRNNSISLSCSSAYFKDRFRISKFSPYKGDCNDDK